MHNIISLGAGVQSSAMALMAAKGEITPMPDAAIFADTQSEPRRGAGVELRLHGCDPDGVAERARQNGFRLLDGPRDQPDHGLREAHVIDADGYVWVPDVPVG